MVSSEDIVEALSREGKYSYRPFLESIASKNSIGDEQSKAINTVELFAFGDYSSYTLHQASFLDLSASLIRKLAKLTLISACNENEGRSVAFSALMSEYGLQHALEGKFENLEHLIMELVDEGVIVAKIDEQLWSVKFLESLQLRDAYNENKYKLRVLGDGEVSKRSVTNAKTYLAHWLDSKVVPTQAELKDVEGY